MAIGLRGKHINLFGALPSLAEAEADEMVLIKLSEAQHA